MVLCKLYEYRELKGYRIIDTETGGIRDVIYNVLLAAMKDKGMKIINARVYWDSNNITLLHDKGMAGLMRFPEAGWGDMFAHDDINKIFILSQFNSAGVRMYRVCNRQGDISIVRAEDVQRTYEAGKTMICNLYRGKLLGVQTLTQAEIGDSVANRILEYQNKMKMLGQRPLEIVEIGDGGAKLVSARGAKGTVVIPDFVTVVARDAFNNTPDVTEIKLSKNLKLIEEYAFHGAKIKTLDIPEGVEQIENYLVYSKREMDKIVFPSTLKKVGSSVLRNVWVKDIWVNAGDNLEMSMDGWDWLSHLKYEQIHIPKKTLDKLTIYTLRAWESKVDIN